MSSIKSMGVAQHVLSMCPLSHLYSQEDRIKWALRYIAKQYQREIQPLLDMLYEIELRKPPIPIPQEFLYSKDEIDKLLSLLSTQKETNTCKPD